VDGCLDGNKTLDFRKLKNIRISLPGKPGKPGRGGTAK
jgi:hypothetical protein